MQARPQGFKTILPPLGNIRGKGVQKSNPDLFRLLPQSVALAPRGGSDEPDGIDEAHDLFGGCERF